MEQLLYVFSLGFSGSDATRAIILILFGALFVSSRLRPFRMTVILLTIDLVWPYIVMMKAGLDLGDVFAMISAQFVDWDDALAGFLVRAAGFYVFIRGTYSLRRKLHAALPEEKQAGALPF